MISNLNQVILSRLGVRFPETPQEACANVRWKLSMLNRVSQVVISSGLGLYGLMLKRMDCFTEHTRRSESSSTVSTSLIIPLGANNNETSLFLSTVSSLVTGNTTDSSGNVTSSSLFSTLASMVTGNMTEGGSVNDTVTLIIPEAGTVVCPGKDYCLPLTGLAAMLSGGVCVSTVIKIVKRCRGDRHRDNVYRLVSVADGVLVMASGIGFVGNALVPTCYPGAGGPHPQVCDKLGPMVLVSSMLYLTYAGILVLSTLCPRRAALVPESPTSSRASRGQNNSSSLEAVPMFQLGSSGEMDGDGYSIIDVEEKDED